MLTTALVVAQVLLIAHAIAPVIEGRASLPDVVPIVLALAAVLVARVLVLVVQESLAHRAATRVVAELREKVLDSAVSQGPRWLDATRSAEVVTLATRGLDDLGPYFVRYLPQLLLAAILSPTVLVVVFSIDLTSGFILLFALPLIPVFMWLVGRLTETHTERRLAMMERLGGQVLDLLAGLATLKALGRERGPGARVRVLADAYNATTLGALRIAFLSGAILEFIASISVALVAVVVGMRLVNGQLDLTTGLAAIMLAPEVLQPLRQVAAHFHASANGLAAATAAFDVIDLPVRDRGTAPAPPLSSTVLELRDVGVRAPGRAVLAPAHLDARIDPGEITVLVGETGAGKSTTAPCCSASSNRMRAGSSSTMPGSRSTSRTSSRPRSTGRSRGCHSARPSCPERSPRTSPPRSPRRWSAPRRSPGSTSPPCRTGGRPASATVAWA